MRIQRHEICKLFVRCNTIHITVFSIILAFTRLDLSTLIQPRNVVHHGSILFSTCQVFASIDSDSTQTSSILCSARWYRNRRKRETIRLELAISATSRSSSSLFQCEHNCRTTDLSPLLLLLASRQAQKDHNVNPTLNSKHQLPPSILKLNCKITCAPASPPQV